MLTLSAVAVMALAAVQFAAASTTPQAHTSATTIQVSGKEFSFKLSSKSIARPGTVRFNFKNAGHVKHDFSINHKHTPMISPGKTASITVSFKKKGNYSYLCTVPGHAAAGMRGTFTVR
jgi:nitrite reductase (NO-forming)